MPNYRRAYIPGGTYFFTLKTEQNAPNLSQPRQVQLLGKVMREARARWPFTTNAIVVLPDHLHTIWSLPQGDTDYSIRWAWIKKEFTGRFLRTGGQEQPVSSSRQKNRRRGVWQRRFWEHAIESEDDFEAHIDYIHWNPVKHGYVSRPADWRYSSFHREVRRGVYAPDWGGGSNPSPRINSMRDMGE